MKILFQGDSITDGFRYRENDQYRGSGYATLVSAKLGFEFPAKYEFVNRGIMGNKVSDLLARMKTDIINIQPDVLSILIGVNDVGHELSRQNGIYAGLYERMYKMLIEEIKTALPAIRIIIMEPFVLKGSATLENWDAFDSGVRQRAAIARRIAEEYQLEFVPLQEKFEASVKVAPKEYWLYDGVHPTAMGHELIAREWIKVFLKE